MAKTEEFDYLVFGDEPGGIWALSQLQKRFGEVDKICRAGWLCQSSELEPIAVPADLAKRYELCLLGDTPFHIEFVSKFDNLIWDGPHIRERFRRLPDSFFNDRGPKAPVLTKAINVYPELLSYAEGFWKLFGRSSTLSPEALLAHLFAAKELTWWDIKTESERAHVEPVTYSPSNPIKKILFSKSGMISLQLADQTTLLTRCLILNGSFFQLNRLADVYNGLYEDLELDPTKQSRWARYPFTITAEPSGVPSGVPPISLFFENTVLPDPLREMHPVFFGGTSKKQTLTLWAFGSDRLDLGEVESGFKRGLAALHWYFPFLTSKTLSYSHPLSSDCLDDAKRSALMEGLEKHSAALFDVTRTHTRTRRSNVHLLSPSLNCHVTYPFGVLEGARSLVEHLAKKALGKRPKPPTRPEAVSP